MRRGFSIGCVIVAVSIGTACGSDGSSGSGGSSGSSCANAQTLEKQIILQRDQDAANGFFGPGPKADPSLVAPCTLSQDHVNPDPNAPPVTPEDYLSRTNPNRLAEYAAACDKYAAQAQGCNRATPF